MTRAASTRLILLLTALSCVLALLIERQLAGLNEVRTSLASADRRAPSPVATAADVPSAADPSSEAFEQLLVNNPFAALSEPPPVVAAPVIEPVVPVKPVAIATAPGQRLVLLEVGDQPRPVRATVGDVIAGWTIIEITPDAVSLEHAGGQSKTVPLKPRRDDIRVREQPPADARPERPTGPERSPSSDDDEGTLVWTPETLKELVGNHADR